MLNHKRTKEETSRLRLLTLQTYSTVVKEYGMARHLAAWEHARMVTRIGINHLLLLAAILAFAAMIQVAPLAAADAPPQTRSGKRCEDTR